MNTELNKLRISLELQIEEIIQSIQNYEEGLQTIETCKKKYQQRKAPKKFDPVYQLHQHETFFDQMHEIIFRSDMVIFGEQKLCELFEEFVGKIQSVVETCKQKKEIVGNELNDMLDKMMKSERILKKGVYNDEIEEMNYKSIHIETKKYQQQRINQIKDTKSNTSQMKRTDELNKRIDIVKGYLSKEEIEVLETHSQQRISSILFDSSIHQWNIDHSDFAKMIQNQNQCFILIETLDDNKKFGCYIENEISDEGKYTIDPYAFIFNFIPSISCNIYQIKDSKTALKIGYEKDEELFTIGKSDIVIKKKEKCNKCSCKQSSFDYRGQIDVLMDKKSLFEVKHIVVIKTIPQHGKQLIEQSIQSLEQFNQFNHFF